MSGKEYEKSIHQDSCPLYTDSDIVLAFEMGKKEVTKNFHKKFAKAWYSVMDGNMGKDTVECNLRELLEMEE